MSGERSDGSFAVRFVVSHNTPGSVMRLTAEYGSVFVRMGIPTTVLFPAVDWWDYKRFMIARLRGRRRWAWIARSAWEMFLNVPFRRSWCGFAYYGADPRIKTVRFWLVPSALDWRLDEVTVVHPPYVLPHVLRTIPRPGITLVSPIYMNLEKAMNSPHEETAAWYRHWVGRDRFVAVPNYTPSQAAREAAQRVGIAVRRVVYNGTVDPHLFRPGPPRAEEGHLVVTLYCDPNPQKGQAEGVEAVRPLKSLVPRVRLCSLGHVLPRYKGVFDHNYGYLHRQALAQAMQETDIFVYPSLYDGFPAPPLQAMACRCAVVTTAVEGMVECAVHEVNALVCQPGDVQEMRRQILRLIEDRALREKLQENGSKTADVFNVERGARDLLAFLREVYEENRG